MDKLEQQCGRKLRDRGARIDLPTFNGRGFRWLEFWKSTKHWKEVVFSPEYSGEWALTREQVVRLAKRATSRSVIME